MAEKRMPFWNWIEIVITVVVGGWRLEVGGWSLEFGGGSTNGSSHPFIRQVCQVCQVQQRLN